MEIDRPLPSPMTPEARPFWDGLREQKLMLPKCGACGHVFWYPRVACPKCHARDIGWVQSRGRGTLHSFEIGHQSFNKAMSSVGADFRNLAAVVVMAALERAGTQVCQPIDRYEVELPDDALAPVLSLIGRLGGTVVGTVPQDGFTVLTGHLPSAAVPELSRRLPDLSGGEAVLTASLDHHAPVPQGTPPARRRTGADPRDREAWFRSVRR